MDKLRSNEEGNKIEFAAVGVTFDNRQQILSEIYSDSIKQGIDNIPVIIEKEPNNQYDPNAVAIKLQDGRSIGYVSKDFNQQVGSMVDKIKRAYIKQIYMNKKRIFNAMINVEL